MSGGDVSYNLRPNKFVERQLFVELLAAFCAVESPEQYVYVSLGGLQLEDHRLLHHQLGFKSLISLEADPVVFQRQEFNRRPYCLECRNDKTSDFVTNFDLFSEKFLDKRFIIWFDYAAANKRLDQIIEFRSLLSKLTTGDLLKLTINANPATLGESASKESYEELLNRRYVRLKEQLHEYLPSDISPADMTGNRFPSILCQSIRRASLLAVESNRRVQPVPLSIFCYQDEHHQMLTMTVCLIENAKVGEFKNDLTKRGWGFLPSNWTDITRIRVPNLSAKERLLIEQQLFSASHEDVHKELPFRFDSDESESLKKFEEYARHYRRYPSYFQVVL